MKKTLKNYLVGSQFVMAVLMLIVAIYLTISLPKTIETQNRLLATMESATVILENCDELTRKPLEVAEISADQLDKTTQILEEQLKDKEWLMKKIPGVAKFYEFLTTVAAETHKMTTALKSVIDESQNFIKVNVCTMQTVCKQFKEDKPITNSVAIGMILFYGLSVVFCSNGILFSVYLKEE